ncbi:MAG: amidohydrolase [Gammaproteobacteria bacterium]|jgi:predicted amidohydrolase YtcJ|nr:amidohydrolase [Gammaproteobacteria bacterium]
MRNISVPVLTLFAAFIVLTTAQAETADSVYFNGRIYTANDNQAWAEAAAIKDGVFVFVGDSKSARDFVGVNTVKVDLQGKMAMPGIHDGHSHMLWGGLNKLFECRLPLGAAINKLIDKLKECQQGQAESEWLIAGSIWSEQLPGDRFHKSLLDEAFPDTPVYIVEGSQHNAFLNSRALEIAGITEDTPKPAGGVIIKDEQGKLTGELVETATVLASKDFKSAPEWQRLEALRWASQLFSKFGITSTQEASGNEEVLKTLNKIDAENKLNQLVAAHIIWGSPKFARTSNETMERLIDNRKQFASRHVKTDFVKMWIDGSPTPPYFTEGSIDPETEKVDLKNILIPPDALNKYVLQLDKMGVKVKMHVAGAGAAHVALDAVANARKANPQSKIIHELGHTNLLIPSDFPRMKALNVNGDMSPTIWHLYGPTLGNPPLPAWQFRTLHENGVLMSIGTDWPVTDDPNIFPALQGLLDRGYESLDLNTGLKMMTINGAIALGWEKEQGSIEVGKTANLIVLDRNLFEIPPAQIGGTNVLKTVFEGRVVYESSPE